MPKMKVEKQCCICRQTKELTEFHVCKDRKDGRQTRCKKCNRVKKWNFKCPKCWHEYQANVDKAMPCPKCWRVSIPCSMNY